MKNNYLITLKPLGNYFFGGEQTFGDYNTEKSKKENEQRINYLVAGNPYPQQTTILGMLRYELLRKKGLLAPRHREEEALDLIGKVGFNESYTGNYGIIEKLTPVFIMKDSNAILPEKTMQQTEIKEGNPNIVQLKYNFLPIINGNGSCFDGYDAKLAINDDYCMNTNHEVLSFNDIFDTSTQVGIKKNYTGKAEEEAFFKQTFYRLKQDYSFAVFVCFSKKPDLDCEVIFMGGDQSLFKIEISEPHESTVFCEIEKQNDAILSSAGDLDNFEIVLLNDCKVSRDIFQYCRHTVNEVRDFRYIITSSETKGFAHFDKKNGRWKCEQKIELLSRNSVLFIHGKKNLEKVKTMIMTETVFRNIGYNYFKIIKK